MYHVIVRQKIRTIFANLNRGNCEVLFASLTPTVHHSFAGEHALGGDRHSIETVKEWYGRLFRLFPNIKFSVQHIFVEGLPWNTSVVVRMFVQFQLEDGYEVKNEVAQFITIRWGKVESIRMIEDTQKVSKTLNHLQGLGVPEAIAQPIVS